MEFKQALKETLQEYRRNPFLWVFVTAFIFIVNPFMTALKGLIIGTIAGCLINAVLRWYGLMKKFSFKKIENFDQIDIAP